MKKLFTWALCALTLCLAATACDDDKEEYPDMERRFAEITIDAVPNPLEAIGGKVPTTMTLTIPPRFLWPEAEVTVTPFLCWEGGEAEALPFGFQGEKAPDIGGTVISYRDGGTISAKAAFRYQEEMQRSDLMLEFTVRYRNRTTVFRIKAGEGVLATS